MYIYIYIYIYVLFITQYKEPPSATHVIRSGYNAFMVFVALGLKPSCQNHCGRKRAGWMPSRFCVSPILGAQNPLEPARLPRAWKQLSLQANCNDAMTAPSRSSCKVPLQNLCAKSNSKLCLHQPRDQHRERTHLDGNSQPNRMNNHTRTLRAIPCQIINVWQFARTSVAPKSLFLSTIHISL